MQPVRQALGVAHEARRAGILADAHEDAVARRPRARYRAGLHLLEQLLVDTFSRATQGEFTQRGQIGRRKVVLERPLGLFWDVDLAFPEPLDQLVGCQIDELDILGAVEDSVRYDLPHADPRYLRHDVVQAFNVLNVDRGEDIDA